MSRHLIISLSLLVIMAFLVCYPVLAASQQSGSSTVRHFSPEKMKEYNNYMMKGYTAYGNEDYEMAFVQYMFAVGITNHKDYASLAAVGQVEIKLSEGGKKFGNITPEQRRADADNYLNMAQTNLEIDKPGGYEENDQMSKILLSKSDLHYLEGKDDVALKEMKESSDYRKKADALNPDGLPPSPLIPLISLGIAGTLVLYRNRRKI